MSLDRILRLLGTASGLDPKTLGDVSVKNGVERRRLARGCRNLDAYARYLEEHPSERQELIETLVVPETWFFRDREPFVYLADLGRQRKPGSGRPLRVLSVPCSTGEEPYSIAMALFDAGLMAGQFTVHAVDISRP